ncbi:MAG: hypothetical protein KIH63_000235 [Candidatus Saccharibacteria bacterium]|nr:hypothetical protein [Candidatus Saccharibacteria bacterium]
MPEGIFRDTGTLHVDQALQRFHERNRGATWLEAGVAETSPDGNWVLEADGRARFDDIHPPQTPFGPNPTEFVSVATGVDVAATDSGRVVIAMNGMPGMPVMDTDTGFDLAAYAAMEPTDDELRAAHVAKITAQGYTFGD